MPELKHTLLGVRAQSNHESSLRVSTKTPSLQCILLDNESNSDLCVQQAGPHQSVGGAAVGMLWDLTGLRASTTFVERQERQVISSKLSKVRSLGMLYGDLQS